MLVILVLFVVIAFGLTVIRGRISIYKVFLPVILQLSAFVYFFIKIKHIGKYDKINEIYRWIPQLGLNLEFTLDGLSLVFALLVTGIGVLVFIYAHSYMRHYGRSGYFYFYLTIFSAAMLGLVLSANMIQLFIFWELTSLLSFLLISFFHEKEEARKAALQSLYITGFGGLCLLAGFLIIGGITGSYSLENWLLHADAVKSDKLYLPALLLILVGAFTKSAQFPFHFWLPGAMQAPTPVSSYLHSATMVKAGIFLLARLTPVLGDTPEWTFIIPLIGVLTMLTGSYFAITQTDLKAILAYTTISALGILVLMLGIGTTLAVKAAMVFLFVHAFYKASLFMLAGFIDKKTGTRDISKLGGLIHHMPFTFVFALLALFSMAGLPPMLGFLSKELIYEAKVHSPGIASMVLILGISTNVLLVATSLFFISKVFLGKKSNYPKHPDEKGLLWLAGPALLTLLSLFLGIWPEALGELLQPALNSVGFGAEMVKLKLWHGFNRVFFLSAFTVSLGVFLWWLTAFRAGFIIKWRQLNKKIFTWNFSDAFAGGIASLVKFSKISTSRIQHGYHRFYLLSTILFVSLLLWFQIYITRGVETDISFSARPFYILGLCVVVFLSALFATLTNSRIVAIIAMGVVGYGISLIYMYYSAIDLAITQILVETFTIVMFVIILQRLPNFARLSSKHAKIRDMLIALLFGGGMMMLAIKSISVDFRQPVSGFFTENSYIKAHGENVVNVILVDFRALDTLGEVTVLAIAALGVYALIHKKSKKE
ncbi:MAG: DUF4040 domain-containing protein [Bacteroidales bacterium]|nr:DUF4040 domain-containing protein [Bacteroidales bacterium]